MYRNYAYGNNTMIWIYFLDVSRTFGHDAYIPAIPIYCSSTEITPTDYLRQKKSLMRDLAI